MSQYMFGTSLSATDPGLVRAWHNMKRYQKGLIDDKDNNNDNDDYRYY